MGDRVQVLAEERKRFFELVLIVIVTIVLVALSRLEANLFELSKKLAEHQEFLTSVVYFGLININVVLVLILSFLIFRNIVKLVLERRKGVFGSRLRTRLVVALVFFALAPTVLLFYVSSRFLTESFDTWFSSKVESTMLRTREAGALVYERDKRRVESLARIALQKVSVSMEEVYGPSRPLVKAKGLQGFAQEYRVFGISVIDASGDVIWSNLAGDELSTGARQLVLDSLAEFSDDPAVTAKAVVDVDEGRDVVRGLAPITIPETGTVVGLILAEERFETQILKGIEGIIQEFASLRPGAELIRLSYLILLVLMVVIIVFSATWLGFYVAKGIIAPIQSLADATKKVSKGNYSVSLEAISDDETGQLIQSFNRMIIDLNDHEIQVKEFTSKLERTNSELDERRKYMEVILKNISAGVMSVDREGRISSVNRAAEKLLRIDGAASVGRWPSEVLTSFVLEQFWQPVLSRVKESGVFNGQVVLDENDSPLTILADGIRLTDEAGVDLGTVVVFDDASEQVKVQRVAAWREVARRIAHEIKNPITPIKLSAQRLLRKFEHRFEDRDQQIFRSSIETIVSEVDSLRDLVNEFSKFARLPAVKTKPADVSQLIRDMVAMFMMSYPDLEFDTSGLQSELPLVNLDKEQMLRVFTNLIANAVAAIRADSTSSKIAFLSSMSAATKTVKIEIADFGPGIPDSLKQKVLEPYFSTKAEGTGLGLAIVSQIVADHGGYLRILDNTPQGTRVVVELPIINTDETR